MFTLDLHGKRHDDIDRIVENFILLSDVPSKNNNWQFRYDEGNGCKSCRETRFRLEI